jgi:hypothetical protein
LLALGGLYKRAWDSQEKQTVEAFRSPKRTCQKYSRKVSSLFKRASGNPISGDDVNHGDDLFRLERYPWLGRLIIA